MLTIPMQNTSMLFIITISTISNCWIAFITGNNATIIDKLIFLMFTLLVIRNTTRNIHILSASTPIMLRIQLMNCTTR